MSSDRNGPVAVITGASSGIGESTARALAADGYRLALLARRADRVAALAEEFGSGALAIEADVTDRDSMVAAAERVQSELGGVDVLVNNAGVMLLAPFSSEQQAEIRQMVETNLLGAMTDDRRIPRPAARRRRRPRQHLIRRRAHGEAGLRRLQRDQVGAQRLVGGAAPGASARRPRDRDRAGRRGHRAHRPHHPCRHEAGRRAVLRRGRPSPPRTSPR